MDRPDCGDERTGTRVLTHERPGLPKSCPYTRALSGDAWNKPTMVGEGLVSDLQHDRLREEQAVIRTMNRYSRALDYGLADEWLDVFTVSARYETVLPDGTQYCLLTKREDFVRYLSDYPHPPEHRQKHMLINPVIEVNGDDAQGDSGWLFFTSDVGGSRPRLSAFGRYRDRFRRVAGVWRIADRVCETEAMDIA